MGDEEAHAISAMLKGNQTIAELNLKGNLITDEGCRAISSILSAPSVLEFVDLSYNHISRNGIKIIVEALERSQRVQRVFVHAGGKVEALGQTDDKDNPTDTVCIVDLRNNSKSERKEGEFGVPSHVEMEVMNEVKNEDMKEKNNMSSAKPRKQITNDVSVRVHFKESSIYRNRITNALVLLL